MLHEILPVTIFLPLKKFTVLSLHICWLTGNSGEWIKCNKWSFDDSLEWYVNSFFMLPKTKGFKGFIKELHNYTYKDKNS